jgi:hypothetical protein
MPVLFCLFSFPRGWVLGKSPLTWDVHLHFSDYTMSVAPGRIATPEYRAKLDELYASLKNESIRLEQAAKTHSGIAANRHDFLGRMKYRLGLLPRIYHETHTSAPDRGVACARRWCC